VRSLFITYDGLLSPLGQSQILPYLRGLTGRGHQVTILSFEQGPHTRADVQAGLRAELDALGIGWHALDYHKSPSVPATAFDVVVGAVRAALIIKQRDIQILHARSYVPTLIALLALGRDRGRKLVFDMRGFWADERIDGNLWDRRRKVYDAVYRLAKGLERWALRRADHVVILTRAGARLLPEIPGAPSPLPPVTVIPTCVDLDRFQPAPDKLARRQELGLPAGRPILVYQGSIGTWYLLAEMVAFVRRAKQRWPDLLWLVLAPGEHQTVRAAASAAGLREGDDFRLEALPHAQVPRWLAAADAAFFFIRPSYSKTSSCPTKFGECLACGLPVVANAGVGDVAETIADRKVGAVVAAFDDASFDQALHQLTVLWADKKLASRCRQAAEADFDLVDAVSRYDAIYRSL
jgi:glycosyltransferase involved in cell wall biosynthesis